MKILELWEWRREWLESREHQYVNVEENILCASSTTLNPQFAFSKAATVANSRMLLIKECEDYLSNHWVNNPSQSVLKLKVLQSMYNDMLKDNDSDKENDDLGNKADFMAEMYLKDQVQPQNENSSLLEYWKVNKSVWPALAYLASKYLSALSSSASSKWLFNTTADTVSADRNRLLRERECWSSVVFEEKLTPCTHSRISECIPSVYGAFHSRWQFVSHQWSEWNQSWRQQCESDVWGNSMIHEWFPRTDLQTISMLIRNYFRMSLNWFH